jgi:hypothetical protein
VPALTSTHVDAALAWLCLDLPAAAPKRVDEEFFETHLRRSGTVLTSAGGHGQDPLSVTALTWPW